MHLEHCLPALARQSRMADEVIVIDNGSADGSVEWLAREHPRVRVVALNENRGFSGGNAAGYKVATGDAIVLLNNDTAPESDWLERLAAAAESDVRIGIVASLMTTWNGVRIDSAGDGVKVSGRGFQHCKFFPVASGRPSGRTFSACAGAALYKRAVLEDVGFLEDRFFMNCEDTDLSFRARLRGWEVWYCAEAKVCHRVSASQKVGSSNNVFYNARNHIWVYLRCMPLLLMIKWFPCFMADLVMIAVNPYDKERLTAYIRGVAAGFACLPWVWEQRKKIQARRVVGLKELDGLLSRPQPWKRICAEWHKRRAPQQPDFDISW